MDSLNSKDKLDKWKNKILLPSAKQAIAPNPPIISSSTACKWCDAKSICPELHKHANQVAEIEFKGLYNISAEQKLDLYNKSEMIISFLKELEIQLTIEIKGGSTEYKQHLKLVTKRTNRRFSNEAQDVDFSPLLEILSENQVFNKKIDTISNIKAALESKLSKKEASKLLNDLLVKPRGAIVIAPINSKETFKSDIESDFSGLADKS